MKLHGLARVKNEADVIEEFVRHNLRFLDGLTVIDNASFDGTLSVLESLRAEGLPLSVEHDPMLQKRQSRTITSVARRLADETSYDALVLLDADEFLKARDRAAFEAALTALPRGSNGLLRWHTYVPTEPGAEASVLGRVRYRRAAEPQPEYFKTVLFADFVRRPEFAIAPGNHSASDALGEAPAAILDGIALAHFPVRSLEQIRSKILLGGGAYLTMPPEEVRMNGWHQRRLFNELEAGAAWNDSDLRRLALNYTLEGPPEPDAPLVFDPVPGVERRYGDAAITDPMQLAAGYVRQLATALAEPARPLAPSGSRGW